MKKKRRHVITYSREHTREEIRKQFLDMVRSCIHYWATDLRAREGKTLKESLSALAHSILVILDGGTALPAFLVVPAPHSSDKEYRQREGENWYPLAPKNIKDQLCDIGGGLHEEFYRGDGV
jgi:hypothetical protein